MKILSILVFMLALVLSPLVNLMSQGQAGYAGTPGQWRGGQKGGNTSGLTAKKPKKNKSRAAVKK